MTGRFPSKKSSVALKVESWPRGVPPDRATSCLPRPRLRAIDGGLPQVSGGHLPQALMLADRLLPEFPDFAGSGSFEILGRDDDMVKIAGKRASCRR